MSKVFISKSDISDVMIERPISFSIKTKHFCVYPATLGKIQLMIRLLETIGVNEDSVSKNFNRFVFEATSAHRNECLRLVAYSTLPGMDCLDESKVLPRIKVLRKLDDMSIASLLLAVLAQDKSDAIKKQYCIDKENKKFADVMKVKQDDKSSIAFGGKSIWGTLIDAACERYGWSYQYVLWGISYSNLQLMLADQVRSVYLSEEERKKLHISTDNIVVRADDTKALNEFIKTQSWK